MRCICQIDLYTSVRSVYAFRRRPIAFIPGVGYARSRRLQLRSTYTGPRSITHPLHLPGVYRRSPSGYDATGRIVPTSIISVCGRGVSDLCTSNVAPLESRGVYNSPWELYDGLISLSFTRKSFEDAREQSINIFGFSLDVIRGRHS